MRLSGGSQSITSRVSDSVPAREVFLAYFTNPGRNLSLAKDALEARAVHSPVLGADLAIPRVGGLHHRCERRAA